MAYAGFSFEKKTAQITFFFFKSQRLWRTSGVFKRVNFILPLVNQVNKY